MNNIDFIGVAIEDSYISAGLVNLETRKVLDKTSHRKRINPQGTADEIITSWAKVIKEVFLINPENEKKIGIGLTGPCDYDLGLFLRQDKDRYGGLYQKNIKDLLAEKLDIKPSDIRLINDAACFFQGEVFGGAVRGYKKSFGLTLGLGLGSARYSFGKVEDANLWNSRFKEGIAEDYLTSKLLLKRFKELSGIQVNDLLELKNQAPNNPFVQQVFDEFALNLSQFLIEVIKVENPEVILIGGHMESSNRFFFDKVIENVVRQGKRTPILRAVLGERANIIGAASIWYETGSIHS